MVIWDCLKRVFSMLTPRIQIKNPVIFSTYITAIVTTIYICMQIVQGDVSLFNMQLGIWIWLTVIFANFSEVVAESRGKVRAAALEKAQLEIMTKRLKHGIISLATSRELRVGDVIICEAGDIIPVDGEVIEGVAMVDEAAITGESAPVIREATDGCSAIIAGTTVLSDRLKIRVTSEKGHSFLDYMINLFEGEDRKMTPGEISLQILLVRFTIISFLVVCAMRSFFYYSMPEGGGFKRHGGNACVGSFICLPYANYGK